MSVWGQYIKDCNVANKYVLTPYLVNDGNIHPVAIVCPGGGYKMICDFREGKPIAEYLNSKGINAFVLRYRFRKQAHYPNPQDDLARAVKELVDHKDEWKLDMDKLSIWGLSAGGHLAATYGFEYSKYNLPKPHTLVLIYPVITLGERTHKGTKKYLIGANASQEEIINRSIFPHVDANYPRTFIWCGDKDKSVPPINSNMMVQALQRYNVEHVYKMYTGVGHGVGLATGTSAEGWIDSAIEFWLKK